MCIRADFILHRGVAQQFHRAGGERLCMLGWCAALLLIIDHLKIVQPLLHLDRQGRSYSAWLRARTLQPDVLNSDIAAGSQPLGRPSATFAVLFPHQVARRSVKIWTDRS